MYLRCCFCDASFGTNEAIVRCRVGRRFAFDVAKGRFWVVCRRCERWNLAPIEEGWEAAEECERWFRGTRLHLSTPNIGLARLREGTELVRIGKPLRPELAAWRYGDQFGRRRRRTLLAGGAGVATIAALVASGAMAGAATGITGLAILDAGGVFRQLRDRRSVVCRVPMRNGDVAIVRGEHLGEARILTGGPWGESWGLAVGYGHGFAVLTRDNALQCAGLLLARINRFGASAREVQQAVELLDRHGDAASCFRYAAARPEPERHRLARLPVAIRLALEMAAHEETERAALEGELMLVERAWREAEEIAEIADALLLPEAPAP